MRSFLIIIFATLVVFASCDKTDGEISRISSPGKNTESVFLTHDHNENPVIVWTERDQNNLALLYAVSTDDGKSFAEPVRVTLNGESATHAEGMPKVAFKSDGTVIVAYETKAPTKENKYAGYIHYITSGDQGRSWTDEQYLHNDTVEGRSRSYFDIETLPDGEIGASWLDIKLDTVTGGRSVRFAKTNYESKFGNEILIDSSACQCCRIDVYADATHQVNVAYRGLVRGPMGQSIRDMMIATSQNNGSAFTAPTRISVDNWNIDGCPHTGPALCSNKESLHALWYTEGSGTGIYYAHREKGGKSFASKQSVSSFGRHPQASSNEDAVVIVWEENAVGDRPVTRVHYQVNNEERVEKGTLTPVEYNAYLPVVTQTKTGFLVAFIMEKDGAAGTYIRNL